jgi:energy-coupling factor transporter ATP-binding protein EcfA2
MAKTSRLSGLSMAIIHDRVLDMLRAWQAETEMEMEMEKRFFYLRRTKDERFEKGYWFPGDEETYLNVSFWSGSDTKNKTANAYFQIHARYGCRAMLTARESDVKRDAFIRFVQLVGKDGQKAGYELSRKDGEWVRGLGDFLAYEDALNAYLYNKSRGTEITYQCHKSRLDDFIRSEGSRIGEEFETPFGFLNETEFNESLRQTLEQRERLRAGIPAEIRFSVTASTGKEPYRLTGFTIQGFQGIKHTVVEAVPDAQWIFLTGDNGFGKTSVLRALAVGLSSHDAGAGQWDKAFSNGQITVSVRPGQASPLVFVASPNGRTGPAETTSSSTRGLPSLDAALVAYGPTRLLQQEATSRNVSRKDEHNVASLFAENYVVPLRNFDFELEQAEKHDKQGKYKYLLKALQDATDGRIQTARVVSENSKGVVLYTERISPDDGTEPFTVETRFDNLATGLRSIINLVADIYVRLAAAQGAHRPEELVGIVIIDELENHLHPRLQRALPGTLSKVFPGLQFIASTHSPIPFLGAPKGSVFLRVGRDKERGITVEVVDVDVSVLLPNTILSSPLFGFEELVAESHDGSQRVRVEDTYQQIEKNDATAQNIKEFMTDERTKELLALLGNPTA